MSKVTAFNAYNPTWMPVGNPAVSVPVQLSATVLEKAKEGIPVTWAPAPR